MSNKSFYIRQLIQRHLENSALLEEGREVFAYLKSKNHQEETLIHLQTEFDKRETGTYNENRWDIIFNRIDKQIDKPKTTKTKFRFIIRIAIAATMVALFLTTIIIYNLNNTPNQETVITKANIKPGKNTATLTLANGNKIILDERGIGELAQEPGVSITKNQAGELIYRVTDNSLTDNSKMNTLSTANGQTAKVTLPDGTKVWLNAASSISYPSSFAAATRREVSLSGEAYFEAKHDEKHPFIVKSTDQSVEVLGTNFNINGYTHQPATLTTLLAGKVKIQVNNYVKLLNPGEQAQNFNTKTEPLKVITAIDVDDVIAWKNGYFVFSDRLENIMEKIAKWYDVKIIYQTQADQSIELQGKISRQKDINDVLNLLEKYSGGLKFKVEDKTIIVSK